MTDRESAFLCRWRAERAMYDAWGSFVVEKIVSLVHESLADPRHFFKIPTSYRIKDEASLLDKAFRRHKNYEDPYADIEDKVGGRIVVLFADDIRYIEPLINSCQCWRASMARDYEQERLLKPYEFDYQSLHYIVRSIDNFKQGEIEMLADLPCELQIRTILQHAYSELTHDTIYKPNVQANPKVKRAAAKSMALIEATSDYFSEVRKELDAALAPGNKIADILDRVYHETVGGEPSNSAINSAIIDRYSVSTGEAFEAKLRAFLEEKSYVLERVKERMGNSSLYRQASILLLYYAIRHSPNATVDECPVGGDELAPLYGDLGERLPDTVR